MHGTITSYSGTTMVVDITHKTGAGTYSSWVISLDGTPVASSVAWGTITGTLSAQTDLQTALNDKVSLTGSYANPSWITSLAWSKISGTPTTLSGYGITNAWSTTGNLGTTAGTNFIGTIDNQDVVFKTNGIERARFLANGSFGIGTATPLGDLDVNGSSWSYIRSNTGITATNPSASANRGFMFSWNQSASQGENQLLYGVGAGSDPRLDIGSWNGSAKQIIMTLKGGNVLIKTLTNSGFDFDLN
jgi:hypothetical protein